MELHVHRPGYSMKMLRALAPPRALESRLVHFRPAGLPFTWHGGGRLVQPGVARTIAARGEWCLAAAQLTAGGVPGHRPTICGDVTSLGNPKDRESSLPTPFAHPAQFIHFLSHSFIERRPRTDRAAPLDLLLRTYPGQPG